jgi:acyl carrier protein
MEKNVVNKIDIENFLKKIIFKKKIPKKFKNFKILKIESLDSLSIFKIIILIESKYKIKLSDNEIFSSKFSNIKNMTTLILKKLKT